MRLTTMLLAACMTLSVATRAEAQEDAVDPTPPNAVGLNLGSSPILWLLGGKGAVVEVDYERRLSPRFSFVFLPQLVIARAGADPVQVLAAVSAGARFYPRAESLRGFHVGATIGAFGRKSGGDALVVSPAVLADLAYNLTLSRALIFTLGLRGIFIFPAELPVIWPRVAIAYAF